MSEASKLEKNPTLLTVVAAAFERSDGYWLMHRRPFGKHHGGLWEFAGGKVELGETPVNALIREIDEELGISIEPRDAVPVGFAESEPGEGKTPIVILLYKLTSWSGEPAAMEGGAIGWFTPDEIDDLAKPPLDWHLADRLFRKIGS